MRRLEKLACGLAVILAVLIVIAIAVAERDNKQEVANGQNEKVEDIIVAVVEPTEPEVVEEEEIPAEEVVNEEFFTTGIDISEHEGKIDAAKLDNMSSIIVRLGYSGYGNGRCVVDKLFVSNMEKLANYNGVLGLYWASHAVSEEEIEKENEYIVSVLNTLSTEMREKIAYLFIDREHSGTQNGRANNLSKRQFNAVLAAQVHGLQAMLPEIQIGVYTNLNYLLTMVDYDTLGDVPYWVAWYVGEEPDSFDRLFSRTAKDSAEAAEYLEQNIVMWQWSEDGVVDGISADLVDINLVSSKMLG